MPVHTSDQKRSSRKQYTDEQLENKRARGEIACAECKRLKLKCDKSIPCNSCVKRGCPSVCPNGTLSSKQGTRFVLADTTELHKKIAEMGQRIQELEDALGVLQSVVSTEAHPLLREELLGIKFGPDVGVVAKEKPPLEHSFDVIDAFGTFTIGDMPGDGKYFGRSAGSEALFLAGADLATYQWHEDIHHPLPTEVARLSSSFPFHLNGTVDVDAAFDLLLNELPEQPRAWSLCEAYLEHATWAFRPIRREEMITEIVKPVYGHAKDRADGLTRDARQAVSPHKLAVAYMLFSIGALVDLTIEPLSHESEKYFRLCQAALSLRPIFDSPEISTVQALVLMASYHAMGGMHYSVDTAWSIMSLGTKLAQSLGLHRDSARWNMDAKTVERRRGLFYEIFSSDLFYSIGLGRQPSIRLSYCDTELPNDDEATLDDEGNIKTGFYRWKYEFCRDVFSQILEATLTAEPPSYQTVLDMDRKVREKALPPHLNLSTYSKDRLASITPLMYMQGCLLNQHRTVVSMYLHRSFFAQAMLDHAANPLRSPYAPSFLAAYRCASSIIKLSADYLEHLPQLAFRLWSVWTHLLSASIIVGTIVARSPGLNMAPNALIELDIACDLFEKGAPLSRRARSGYGILISLKAKAHQAYAQFQSGQSPSSDSNDVGSDEIALFGGQTKILFSKVMARRNGAGRQTSEPRPGGSDAFTGTLGDASPTVSGPLDMHPSLVEYLSQLPQDEHPQYPAWPGANTFASSSSTNHAQFFGMDFGGSKTNSAQYFEPSTYLHYGGSSTNLNHDQADIGSAPLSFYNTATELPTQRRADYNQQDHMMMDFGTLVAGGANIDESWTTFMQRTGVLEDVDWDAQRNGRP
ncbi:hypothetical protein CYLTODRAFT_140102 [Cylindrobasidium torrendii FP15055 ss-10]|uniref:Zn(2)-C6 fungal-type domain-containing protein n=1 Tax=Cylindrobasidium torrendii FP15055 ss-10 TaxID=1314674 RepID=A0A0D7BNU0_9AGAR|nr:hypothetical protein CYLTODRAFT_140102 [Cylindrobasidium torrendii FP15055 ss-10]